MLRQVSGWRGGGATQ